MTHAIADQDLLSIWERGLGQHPLDRALTVLAAIGPRLNGNETGPTRQALARLPLGERDRQLLAVHERIFGQQLAGRSQCPACQSVAQFELTVDDLRMPPSLTGSGEPITLVDDGYRLDFHLPSSIDLASVARLTSGAAARQALIERCTLSADYEGVALDVASLPERVLASMAAEMARRDPQADLELALVCPDCGREWAVLLDVEAFLWTKIDALARRLLREVDVLARAYGWRESDILAMSAARRQAYLELAS